MWTLGPVPELFPDFRVAVFAPGPRTELWVYASIGAWEADPTGENRLEFIMTAPEEDLRQVELVTMVAYYHHKHHLDHAHTLPMGEPWVENSSCDHLLVSLPYPFGTELEVCALGSENVSVYWLLPITRQERDFKVEHGLDALEQKFEDAELEYWDPQRDKLY